MKKIFNLTIIASFLCSLVGCTGEKPSNDTFPYATPEIKQKVAKAIDPSLTTVPKNFFETFNYAESNNSLDRMMDVLDTPEEKWFWNTLINMRLQMLRATAMTQENISLSEPTISPEVLSAVIAYEEANPYKPNLKKIDEARKYLIDMALGNMPIPPSAEQAEAYIEQWGGRDTGKFFKKVREELLQYYKGALAARKRGEIPEDYDTVKKSEAGITEYAIHMQAPTLYPAELLKASFSLSDEYEDAVYVFPKIFLKNAVSFSNHSIRLENEKPLPYTFRVAWYSIAENKSYVLEADLPRQEMIEKLMVEGDRPWDALLITLAPYGQITLYAYNQITGKTEQLARYQAKEHSFLWENVPQMEMMYQSPEEPAASWNEYQQMALRNFPKAAENLKKNGLPEEDPSEKTYWNENLPK